MAEKNSKTLKKQLFYKRKNAYNVLSDDEIKAADDFCEGYKHFIDVGKTEREACAEAVKIAESKGFKPFERGKKYCSGDKLYMNNRGKSIILAVIGSEPIENGVNIVAAHIDSPRLDLKQNPLYESEELGYFKTHYYGGIKKYQWPATPLALHGVICRADGSQISVALGEDENDPVFIVTDLLPHLSEEQYNRPASKLIKGEELNILIGSRPFKDDDCSEAVKLNLMCILNEKYGITEEDFISAELEYVPAFKAKDVGFDRSMIGAYGQDDRVCSYPALMAIAALTETPAKTAVTILTDKEEIGSEGCTGLKSSYLRYFIDSLAKPMGSDGHTVLSASKCLSADVNAGFDPTFPDAFEKLNSAYLNRGVVATKYTGSRGKSGTNDASAEYVSEIRSLFNANGVIWQTGELGKVDFGGGGTVAMYISNLDVDTIDIGVPVLSMHAPFEITAKNDVYMAYRAFYVFQK